MGSVKKRVKCGLFIFIACFLTASCGLSFSEQRESEDTEIKEITVPSEKEMLQSNSDTDRESEAWTKEEKQEESYEGLVPVEEQGYAFGRLNEEEQTWYLDMLGIMKEMGTDIALSPEILQPDTVVEELLDKVFSCVMLDHPELFYVEGYSYVKYTLGEHVTAVSFSGTYSLAPEEALKRKAEIETAAGAWLGGIQDKMSDYEKVLYLYNTLIHNTEYDVNALDNQNIYSVLVGGKSVCQGYAKAFQYLCLRLGISCALVQGQVFTGESHCWNMVQTKSGCYLVDVTWGDASYQREDFSLGGSQPDINYDYFMITSKEMELTHKDMTTVSMPKCVATEDNYYVRNRSYFESFDKELLERQFQMAIAEERHLVSIKCADTQVMEQMKEFLIEEQEIFRLWPDAGEGISYSMNEQVRTLTFWMTNE